MTPNGFPGSQAFLMLIPLLFFAAALWVLTIAVRDQRGRPKSPVPRLPDPNSHPLHHVRVSMVQTRRRAQVAARRAQAEPPGSDEVRSGQARPFRKQA
jgi:hypothetical protein